MNIVYGEEIGRKHTDLLSHLTVDGYLTRQDMASLVLLQLVIRVLHVRSAINMVTPL